MIYLFVKKGQKWPVQYWLDRAHVKFEAKILYYNGSQQEPWGNLFTMAEGITHEEIIEALKSFPHSYWKIRNTPEITGNG